MKKLLLASLVSALSVTAAHAAPKVYGKLFTGLDYVSKKGINGGNDVDTWTLNSNASRFGIKGEDELTPTLSAIYQAEWGISATLAGADADKTKDLNARNRFLGLKSTQLGALKFGAFDTALKESQNKVDLFNDMVGESADMKSVLTGENRVNRVIGWEAPELEGLPVKATLNLILDQGADGKNGDNGFSGMVAYDQNGLYVALAGDKKVKSDFFVDGQNKKDSVTADTIRVVGQFDLAKLIAGPAVTLGALYQTAKPSDDKASTVDKQDAWLLSANAKLPETVGMDGLGVFAQYQQSTTSFTTAGASDLKRTQFGGGVSYAFSKNTAVYGYLAQQKFENPVGDATKTNILGTALEHKF